MPKLLILVKLLKYNRKFTEIASVFNRNYYSIKKCYSGNFLPDCLINKCNEVSNSNGVFDKTRLNQNSKTTYFYKDYVFNLFRHDNWRNAARQIIFEITGSEGVIKELVRTKPYLPLEILDLCFNRGCSFQTSYVDVLLSDSESVLYNELLSECVYLNGNRFEIRPENIFLTFYLKDANVAKKYNIWKPVGDYVLKYLSILKIEGCESKYNLPFNSLEIEEYERCPIYISLQFFEIMVIEALYQKVSWHMWLFYIHKFVEKICENIMPNKKVNLEDEFPTRYHYLLYKAFDVISKWLDDISGVSEFQENVKIDKISNTHDNESIAKSVALTAGVSVGYIIKSNNVELKFKSYIIGKIVKTLCEISNVPKKMDLANVLALSIKRG